MECDGDEFSATIPSTCTSTTRHNHQQEPTQQHKTPKDPNTPRPLIISIHQMKTQPPSQIIPCTWSQIGYKIPMSFAYLRILRPWDPSSPPTEQELKIRWKVERHNAVVEAICVIIQYVFEHGRPPFEL
jgi:hypothetical protein